MTKEQLQEHYKILSDIYDKYYDFEYEHKNGKNAKIRDAAFRRLQSQLSTCDFYIRRHTELYKLITSDTDTASDFSRTISYDEFISWRYFSNDMAIFLKKLKSLIDNYKTD